MTPVVELRRVSRCFVTPQGRVEVLRPLDLAVARGEFVGILGASGSGKSTLLHLCGLLDRPSTGTVLHDGEAVDADDDARAARLRAQHIGMLFQASHLLAYRSVLDNVAFRFRYLGLDLATARARAAEALARLGLSHLAGRPAWWLSGGERARVSLARAIAAPVRVLLADEPTGNLDARSGAALVGLLRDLHRAGTAIVMVSHDAGALAGCDRVLRCHDGDLVPA